MSKQEIQPHHRAAPNGSALGELRTIAVAQLAFKDMLEIPGKLSSQGLKAGHEQNRRHWRITYLPQLRHHQLEVFAPGAAAPEGTYYVHETLVTWWIPAA